MAIMLLSYSEDAGSIPVAGSNCNWCKAPILGHGKKFCSLSCGAKHQQSVRPKKEPIERHCDYCDNIFTVTVPSSPRKYCNQSCAAKANNTSRIRNNRVHDDSHYLDRPCQNCEKVIPGHRTYCGNTCQRLYQQNEQIRKWLAGELDGIQVNGNVAPWIKKWLRYTRGDACEFCGWNQVNPITGKVPVVADHIDGDWRNNRPENLRLVCPNCDSLQPTYQSLNRGKGRSSHRSCGDAIKATRVKAERSRLRGEVP